jgi:hypothetical protein
VASSAALDCPLDSFVLDPLVRMTVVSATTTPIYRTSLRIFATFYAYVDVLIIFFFH